MTTPIPPLPDVDNPLNAPFWAAARECRLLMQQCPCGTLQWPPKSVCATCLRETTADDWAEIEPTGTLWSFIIYHRAFHPAFEDALPYTVAMVKLDAGPMFITNVSGSDMAIGQRLHASFDAVTPDVTLVRFVAA